MVGYERDIPTRKETDRLLRRYGVEVRYVMELDNIETLKRVVEIAARPETIRFFGNGTPQRAPERNTEVHLDEPEPSATTNVEADA